MSYRALTRQSVFDAMLSLHHKGIAVTRESLQQVTGEPLAKIREHIDSLIESGQVERIHRGVYRPVIPYSNRPITVTAMPDGSAKIVVQVTNRIVGGFHRLCEPDDSGLAGAWWSCHQHPKGDSKLLENRDKGGDMLPVCPSLCPCEKYEE